MNKYLIELIKLQSSVILPGFGSLMTGNSKTGKIVFNPLLKFNDGALAKYIAQKEGIDQQAAQNQIAKFVREIEAELGKGNSFDIFQLGKFVKNTKGEIEFLHEGAAIMPASDDTKSVSSKESKTTTAIDKKETTTSAIETKQSEPPLATKPVEAAKHESESLLDKLKNTESGIEKKLEDTLKAVEKKSESAEEIASKQTKNSFKPSEEKAAAEQGIQKPKTDEKPVEIAKNIPLAEASKKDPAAQEKNVFKPAQEDKNVVPETASKVENKLMAASNAIKNEASDDKPADKNPTDTQSKKEDDKAKKDSVKEKFKKDKPQKIKHENPENKKPKKKKRWLVWFILLVIVGGGAAAGWFYKDQINHFLFAGVGDHGKDSTHTSTTPIDSTSTTHQTEVLITEDSTVSEAIDETTEELTEVSEENVQEKPVVNHSSPGGTYHIIGNAFSSEKNAENYVNKMKEKGYSAQNIGKYNGLYLVSLKSFGSKEEAKNNLSSVKADAESAYVFTAK